MNSQMKELRPGAGQGHADRDLGGLLVISDQGALSVGCKAPLPSSLWSLNPHQALMPWGC